MFENKEEKELLSKPPPDQKVATESATKEEESQVKVTTKKENLLLRSIRFLISGLIRLMISIGTFLFRIFTATLYFLKEWLIWVITDVITFRSLITYLILGPFLYYLLGFLFAIIQMIGNTY